MEKKAKMTGIKALNQMLNVIFAVQRKLIKAVDSFDFSTQVTDEGHILATVIVHYGTDNSKIYQVSTGHEMARDVRTIKELCRDCGYNV